MAIDLNTSLAWTSADAEQKRMLDDLQGNILDGHGRKATAHLFLQFPEERSGVDLIHELAAHVTSARKQLSDAQTFRQTGASGGPFIGLVLASAGYRALGKQAKMRSDNGPFDQGMAARRGVLNDPDAAAGIPPADSRHGADRR